MKAGVRPIAIGLTVDKESFTVRLKDGAELRVPFSRFRSQAALACVAPLSQAGPAGLQGETSSGYPRRHASPVLPTPLARHRAERYGATAGAFVGF
jgi:hypothetical protein